MLRAVDSLARKRRKAQEGNTADAGGAEATPLLRLLFIFMRSKCRRKPLSKSSMSQSVWSDSCSSGNFCSSSNWAISPNSRNVNCSMLLHCFSFSSLPPPRKCILCCIFQCSSWIAEGWRQQPHFSSHMAAWQQDSAGSAELRPNLCRENDPHVKSVWWHL